MGGSGVIRSCHLKPTWRSVAMRTPVLSMSGIIVPNDDMLDHVVQGQ